MAEQGCSVLDYRRVVANSKSSTKGMVNPPALQSSCYITPTQPICKTATGWWLVTKR